MEKRLTCPALTAGLWCLTASALAQGPAPEGYRDFRIGMTRKEAHEVVERWEVRPTSYAGQHWTGAPYKGIQAFSLSFADGADLLKHPSKKPESVVKADQLSPEDGREQLQQIHLAFESVQGTDEDFRKTLKERYKEPTLEAKDSLVWVWPEKDRMVVANFSRAFGRLVLTLHIVDGVLRTTAVKQALQEQRQHWERDQKKNVLEGLKEPRGEKLPEARGKEQPEEAAAKRCGGVWRITGFSKNGHRFEGILELRREGENPAKALRVTLTWLDGPFAGVRQEVQTLRADIRHVTVSAYGKIKRSFDVLVLQGLEKKTPEGFPIPPLLFAAAVSTDGRALERGASMDYYDTAVRSVLASTASEPDSFRWRGTRPRDNLAAQAGTKFAGVWRIEGVNLAQTPWRGELRFSAGALSAGLVRLKGTYTDSKQDLHPMHGYCDLEMGRAVFLVDFPLSANPAEVLSFPDGHFVGGGTSVFRLRFTTYGRPDDRRVTGTCSPVLQVGGIVARWTAARE